MSIWLIKWQGETFEVPGSARYPGASPWFRNTTLSTVEARTWVLGGLSQSKRRRQSSKTQSCTVSGHTSSKWGEVIQEAHEVSIHEAIVNEAMLHKSMLCDALDKMTLCYKKPGHKRLCCKRPCSQRHATWAYNRRNHATKSRTTMRPCLTRLRYRKPYFKRLYYIKLYFTLGYATKRHTSKDFRCTK